MPSSEQVPLFSFLHLADTHVEALQRAPQSPGNRAFGAFVERVNGEQDFPLPDFALISGDLTAYGTRYTDEVDEGRRVFATLRCPCYPVAGNHDLATREGVRSQEPFEYFEDLPLAQTNYARVFGEEGLRLSFACEGIRFLGVTLREINRGEGQLEWLAAQLDACGERTVIIWTHFQLYATRSGGSLATWGENRIRELLPDLRDIVALHADRIAAYLFGHVHVNSDVVVDGVHHVSTGALGFGSCTYRLFRVREHRIEVETFELPKQYWSGGHFWPAAEDEEHPDADTYHLGAARERSFTIPLNPDPIGGHTVANRTR